MYIYKTPAGTWAFRVDIGIDPRTGKRRQKSRQGFQRKKDAEAAAHQLLLDVQKAAYVPDTPITIKEFIAQWLERYSPTVKESTLRTRITAAHALENELGAVPIQKLTLPMYQSCINRLAGKYARSTLVLFNGFVRMLMKDARQYGLIQKDPTEFVRLPRPDDSPEEKLPAIVYYFLLRFYRRGKPHYSWFSTNIFSFVFSGNSLRNIIPCSFCAVLSVFNPQPGCNHSPVWSQFRALDFPPQINLPSPIFVNGGCAFKHPWVSAVKGHAVKWICKAVAVNEIAVFRAI